MSVSDLYNEAEVVGSKEYKQFVESEAYKQIKAVVEGDTLEPGKWAGLTSRNCIPEATQFLINQAVDHLCFASPYMRKTWLKNGTNFGVLRMTPLQARCERYVEFMEDTPWVVQAVRLMTAEELDKFQDQMQKEFGVTNDEVLEHCLDKLDAELAVETERNKITLVIRPAGVEAASA